MTDHASTIDPPLAAEARKNLPAFVTAAEHGMIIGGEQVAASSGETLSNTDPTTEAPIASIQRGGADDVNLAVTVARRAFEDASWSGIDPDERGRILYQVATVIDEHAEELAVIDSVNMGGAMFMTRWMLADVVRTFRQAAGWPTKLYGQTAPAPRNRFGYTRKQPLGVVGAIWGWNGPLTQLALKVAPALATGNTVVVKPPEWASLSTLRLVELLADTDLPPGVVNVVTGLGAEAGEALVRHPQVAKIAFTGSTAVGRHVHEVVSSDLKHLTLELGGKSPAVVCADADLDAAARGAAAGFLGGAGQACVSTSRVLVHESVRDEFREKLLAAMAAWTVGDPLDPGTRMGPLVARHHFDRVTGYFDIAAQEGATVVTGARRYGDHGYFVEPTLLEDVTPDMRVVREEIFGPVGALMTFTDLDDAVRQANDTQYGLAASVWTKDLVTANRLANDIDAGTIWVNTYGEMSVGPLPFGGFKQSGIGREAGLEVLDAYTQSKAILIAL